MAEKEYIERGALMRSMEFVTNDTTCPIHIASYIDQIIAQEPAADVVEVVRCKDCKYCHWRLGVGSDVFCVRDGRGMYFMTFKGNDFCSYGERKEIS